MRHHFEKCLNIKLQEIRPVGTELLREDGRTERHDEANSRLSQFCESAEKKLVSQLRPLSCSAFHTPTFRQFRRHILQGTSATFYVNSTSRVDSF